MHLKSQMQYKVSFFLTAFGQFFSSFVVLIGVYFMFLRFNNVDGFTYQQVLICYAAILAAVSLAETFGRGFDTFPIMLGNGEFDRVLVRPGSAIFLVLASKIEFTRFVRLAQSAVVFAYAIPRCGVIWTWDRVVTLCLMVIFGSMIFFDLYLVQAAFSFFTIEALEFMHIFIDGSNSYGRYPFSIYGKNILKLLTFVIPVALVQYYPLLYLLGMKQSVFYMLTPIISLVFLIPCYIFFRFGLRKYKSTGS